MEEYINIDSDVQIFNEWNDTFEKILIVDGVNQSNEFEEEEDDDNGQALSILGEAIETVQWLRLFSISQCPQLNDAISDMDFKLADIHLGSKILVQVHFIVISEKISLVL